MTSPPQIGAVGIGEVYRARDTKLDRDVPLKVLPAVRAAVCRTGRQVADLVAWWRVPHVVACACGAHLVSDVRIGLRPRLRVFNVHPDGKRFVVAPVPKAAVAAKQDKLVFAFKFFDELRRLVPDDEAVMALNAGTPFGTYEIVIALGAGHSVARG